MLVIPHTSLFLEGRPAQRRVESRFEGTDGRDSTQLHFDKESGREENEEAAQPMEEMIVAVQAKMLRV